jgi:DNA-binding Xre family transcriptional regulator
MPINWKLRELLKERGGNSAAKIRKIVLEQTGYQLSTQAVCDLLKRQPKMIRLETIQALCDAFYIRLSDFLEVLPSAAQRAKRRHEPSRHGDATQILAKVLSEHYFQ